jgi:hypothetical protein
MTIYSNVMSVMSIKNNQARRASTYLKLAHAHKEKPSLTLTFFKKASLTFKLIFAQFRSFPKKKMVDHQRAEKKKLECYCVEQARIGTSQNRRNRMKPESSLGRSQNSKLEKRNKSEFVLGRN